MSMSGKAKAIRQCYLCEQLQSADFQNMKLRLVIFKCFSVKNTTRNDLDKMFTKNVKVGTQYVNVVTNVILVILKRYDLIK